MKMGIGLGMSQGSGGVAAAAPDPLLTGLAYHFRNNYIDTSANKRNMTLYNDLGNYPVLGNDLFTGAPNGSILLSNASTSPFNRYPSQLVDTLLPFTIDAWFNLSLTGSIPGAAILNLFLQRNSSASTALKVFWFGVTLQITGFLYDQVDNNVTFDVAGSPAATHHFLLSFDGTTARFYSDGILAGVNVPITRALGTFTYDAFPVLAGQANQRLQNLGGWQRCLSDGGISVGQSATADSDIGRRYNSGNCLDPTLSTYVPDSLLTGLEAFYAYNRADNSGHERHLSLVGAPSLTTGLDGIANAAMLVDNSNYYNRNGAILQPGPFTISVWVKLPTPSHDAARYAVQSGDSRDDAGISATDAQSQWNGTIGGTNVNSTFDMSDAQFHHFVTVYDGTDVYLFDDGVLTVEFEDVAWSDLDANPKFRIGGPTTGVAFAFEYDGLWSRALSFGGVSVGQPVTPGTEVARLFTDKWFV